MAGPITRLPLVVDGVRDVLQLYDRLEVWRSTTGSGGTYVNLTAEDPTSAVLDGSVAGPWNVSGQTLTVVRDGADPKNVVFTGANPLQLSAVLGQINAVLQELGSEAGAGSNKVRLSSALTGLASSLQVSGAAATTLGLSTTRVLGLAENIALSDPTEQYEFVDLDGAAGYFYKTRFVSSKTGRVSSFSAPIAGDAGAIIPGGSVVTATVKLVDASGKPVVGRRVVYVPQSPAVVPNSTYGVLPGFDRIVAITDNLGVATADLVEGITVRMLIEGAQFERTFVVPDVDFDALAVATEAPDPFSIVQAPPRPIRVS